MCELNRLNVASTPFGFIVSSENSKEHVQKKVSSVKVLEYGMKCLQDKTQRTFGLSNHPLLVSVRSSVCVVSSTTENLKDSVLNLGMNDEIVKQLASSSNNPRWAFDSYRIFLQMFGTTVMGVKSSLYEEVLADERAIRGVQFNSNFFVADLEKIIARFKTLCSVPEDSMEQLTMAVQAIYRRWNGPQGAKYRELNNLPADLGVAVLVQEMVFGNKNIKSGTGNAFTRNPLSGEDEFTGEFHSCMEGEEEGKGVRKGESLASLQATHPQTFEQLLTAATELEKYFRDMQEVEFVIESDRLFILDAKAAIRTPTAAVVVAAQLVRDGVISEREALSRLDATHVAAFLHPTIDDQYGEHLSKIR